jgi:hypothetical protein
VRPQAMDRAVEHLLDLFVESHACRIIRPLSHAPAPA